jgi:hypothetical protein
MALQPSIRVTVLALLLQATSGCSLAFMSKAQDPVATPAYPVDCTSSRAAPVLDTICAGYFVANGIYWAAQTSCDQASFGESCVSSSNKTTGVLLSAGLAVLCGVSAGIGYGTATRCQDVKTLNAMCITGNEESCKKLNPAWVPSMRVPAAPAPPAGAGTGCSRDTDCKGDRICVQGSCVEPPPKAPPGT